MSSKAPPPIPTDETVDDIEVNPDENLPLTTESDKLREEIDTLKEIIKEKETHITQCHNDSINQTKRIAWLENKIKTKIFSYESFYKNIKMHQYYTGINRKLFFLILRSGKFKRTTIKLKPSDHLLIVLMKLRRGLDNKDLAYRFHISVSVVSKVFRIWLKQLSKFLLKNAFSWPEKESLRKNLPTCFKKRYKRCVGIIDCTEIFIERPLNLNARAQTWSNYKNTNTIKYLVVCAPTGAVTFISNGWGGRVSDKEITVKSGFLDWIEHGDQILADRGFTVAEEIATVGGILEIPAFTKGKNQLSKNEVDRSRQIANVRIHIERVIGRMRKFEILNSRIKISQVNLLDEIMVCIAGLVNCCPLIVKS